MFENEDKEERTEVKEIFDGLEPFTLDDAVEEDKVCDTCEHYESCPIIIYINKLSKQRDIKNGKPVKTVEKEFCCNIYKSVLDED